MKTPASIALLACEVFNAEIDMLSAGLTHIAIRLDFEIGLHDRPDEMRRTLQTTIDGLDARDDISAIVLAYGLCGRGTAGLHARRHPLVMPRAHDCITVLLGSSEQHARRQLACPGCHHYSPGWNRARRVPGPDRLDALRREYSARFDPEDVEFLLESEKAVWASHHTATFIDLGTPDAQAEAAYAAMCADWLGWDFEHLRGDPALLRDLLRGPWDDPRFLVVPPGAEIAQCHGGPIVNAVPHRPS
jgi:hypothetical protein